MSSLKESLPKEEYQQIASLLGKEPNEVELALFSAMWSEHCSYKSSKVHLKKFSQIKSPQVVASFGENAGVIDLGEGEKIAFKMESHNHPSRIEPLHGAMTGVGGILRDIFAMNARPIALANYLCFGQPDYPITKHLAKGVVRGIGAYGNSIGIPTITGHTSFHPSYNENILVNALALGIYGPEDKIMKSRTDQAGAYIVYAGARTGRDGIHGASMASESFSNQKEKKQSTVQVGDPFYGKLLMEACLTAMKENVLAAQDMGAAGLISSSFEIASKSNIGMTLHLDQVPLRDFSMKPEEILLSESQERMLLICSPKNYPHLQKTFQKWSLPLALMGETTSERKIKIYWKNDLLTSMDPLLLTEKTPELKRPFKKWSFPNKLSTRSNNSHTKAQKHDFKKTLMDLFKRKENCSREFIYNQYDQRVGARTAGDCSFPIGIIQLPYSKRFLGLALGGRPNLLYRDAFEGGKDSILYPGIHLALRGFKPLAVTDCLNFGNPEKEEIMSQFVGAIDGMVEAARELSTPVISGNVSFYNESSNSNIIPTPAIGMVGLKESASADWPKSYFENKGEYIYLIKKHFLTLENSNQFSGRLNPKEISQWTRHLVSLSDKLTSAKVVGPLGLAYTLAKMTEKGIGAQVQVDLDPFATRLYEAVMTVPANKKEEFENLNKLTPIGITTSEQVFEYNENKLAIDSIKEAYQSNQWM